MEFINLIRNLNLGGKNYEVISYEDSLKLNGYHHVAHCGIYSLSSRLVECEQYPTKAALMMLFRNDGMIGFPGGSIDKEDDIMEGLKRELKEEINLDISQLNLPDPVYVAAYQYPNESTKMCCHFYKLEVSIDVFRNLEKDLFNSEYYEDEIFGVLRVPLFTMEDGHRGLPSFLCNNFIADSRDQLLILIANIGVMTTEEILKSVDLYRHIMFQRYNCRKK